MARERWQPPKLRGRIAALCTGMVLVATILLPGGAAVASGTAAATLPSAASLALQTGRQPSTPAVEPSPTSTSNRGDSPASVWSLLQDLPSALAPLPSADLGTLAGEEAELTVGIPREVFAWNTRATPGDAASVVQPAESWLAPLSHEGRLVGVLLVDTSRGGEPKVSEVWDDADLAADLATVPSKAQLVRGAAETGWYQVAEGRVSAADAVARDLLVGSIPVEQFLEIYDPDVAANKDAAKVTTQPPTKTMEEGSSWRGPAIVGGIVAVVLLLVVLLMWLLRPEPPEDEEPRAPLGMLLLRRPATSKPPKAGAADGAERAAKLPR